MYNIKNTLRHGLLFAALMFVSTVGFAAGPNDSGDADLGSSLCTGNSTGKATSITPDITTPQGTNSNSYSGSTYSENGTSGPTAYIYYGYPYRNAPNYNYYPYRPYFYHYYYYPYRPYYYHYGW